jgi:hypothetical protein
MSRLPLVLASALLLALLVPAASAGPTDVCRGQRVGWEGYQETCVHAADPHCLVEYSFYNLGEESHVCYGV